MRLKLDELFALYVMNKIFSYAPGLTEVFPMDSKLRGQRMFTTGQRSLIKRGLGTGEKEDKEIIGNGYLLGMFAEQSDYIRIDNITMETSNNKIMGMSITETENNEFEVSPLYKGFLFAQILGERPNVLKTRTTFLEGHIREEKVIEKLNMSAFYEKYGNANGATLLERYENKERVYSRILFEAGFSSLQYDLLTEELKENIPNQTAFQLYKWMDIMEMNFSQEELHQYFEDAQRRGINGTEN